jgi:hypothetical protein
MDQFEAGNKEIVGTGLRTLGKRRRGRGASNKKNTAHGERERERKEKKEKKKIVRKVR